jgi:hypothetical protein
MGIISNILILFLFTGINFAAPEEEDGKHLIPSALEANVEKSYISCDLEGKLDFEIFQNAMESLARMEYKNEEILTIIDFSKQSTEKRLFIIDLKNQKILHHTLVAHGKNTGQNEAVKFSNVKGSNSSSLGLYRTAEPYHGKHGYSLRLDGLEKGFNDNARSRAVVMHSASYVSEKFIEKYGRLGRSFGCPAVPAEHSKEIIDLIKNGSCLYIYANDSNYLENSILSD